MHSSTASLIIVIKMLRAFEKRRKNPKYGKRLTTFLCTTTHKNLFTQNPPFAQEHVSKAAIDVHK